MPIKQESLNRDLYGLLKSRGYRPEMFTSGGKKVSIPDEAEAFQFDFMKDGENYGKATITIDGLHRLIVYYNNDIANSPKGDGQDISWTTLMKHLKRWAKNKALGFQLSDQDDLESDMAKREHNKIEGLNEGYYAMGKKASYSDNVPSTKIILQHSRQIEEGEQRYRNVEKIFVENAQGERFLLPTNKPGLARVYARHIAEGGTPYDERGTHITSLVEEYQKMAGFVRATRNHQFNESAQRLISEGINHYQKLRETLHKMSGKRGYTEYFNNYSPALMEDEGSTDLSEMFMQSSLDPRIENVMPILGKLSKNLVETEVPHIKELEEWAESVAENRMADLLSAKVSGAVGDIKSSVPNLDRENFEEQLWDYLDAQYGASVARTAFNNIDDYWMEYQGVTEDLDANQKRVGQLGPTEKITKSNPTRGKLVGASESVEQGVAEDDKLQGTPVVSLSDFSDKDNTKDKYGRTVPKNLKKDDSRVKFHKEPKQQGVAEMDKSQPSSDRGGESSGNPYAKGGKATPVKAKDVVKQGVKALNKAHPDYSKHEKKLISKMSNAEKVDKGWRNPNIGEGTYNKDVERAFPDGKARGVKTGASAPKGTSTMPKDKEKAKGKPVAEGQDDLEAILRIIKK
jgi:hypothetical protein